MNLTITRFRHSSALLDACADIYGRTWNRSVSDARWTFDDYLTQPHFVGVVACWEDEEIGFALGTQSLPGQWWHDCVAGKLGADHPALQEAFILCELAVLPLYRNMGIGRQLHDTLLASQPMPNALLSTMSSNVGALRFYQRLNWQVLHRGLTFFDGQEPYAILAKRLP
ncbi:MAG: N-acetyltransferase [Anaerolineae bacterium]